MSEVERAISGECNEQKRTARATTTATTSKLATNDSNRTIAKQTTAAGAAFNEDLLLLQPTATGAAGVGVAVGGGGGGGVGAATAHYYNNDGGSGSAATTTLLSTHQKHLQQQQQQQQREQQYRHHQQQQQQQQHPHHHPHQQRYGDGTPSGRCCFSHLLKIVFSTPGLVLLVSLYSVMGALIFPLLEAPQDITKSAAIAKSREDCLRELWIITEKLNVLYERNWTMLVHEQLRRFEGTIVAATRNGAMNGFGTGLMSGGGGNSGPPSAAGGATTTTALGRFGGDFDQARWSFSEALLYSVTVITTIGHGSLTPKTAAGKIATILYALIGVPLMLMCLSSLGALLADGLQSTYARICCRLSQRQQQQQHHHHHNQQDHSRQQHDHSRQRQQQQRSSQQTKRSRHDTHNDVLSAQAKAKSRHQCQRRYTEVRLTESGDMEGGDDAAGQSNLLDYKNCKYEGYPNSGGGVGRGGHYDEATHGSMALQRAEESCQLLCNSSSPAKAAGLGGGRDNANEQYYHETAAAQPRLPQPDVMLMATKPPGAANAAAATTSSSCSATPLAVRKFSHPQPLAQYIGETRSATPSPQHQHFAHPLQTFHIVTTASANSSPTHHALRQYATLQPHSGQQQQHHLLQQQQYHHLQQQQQPPRLRQQQQHFVAVPSSLIRFQAAAPLSLPPPPLAGAATTTTTASTAAATAAPTTAGCTATATSCHSATQPPPLAAPPNCYQPATATIYFPLPAPGMATAEGGAGGGGAGSTAASALLCHHQPLVKYHTIQLQHKHPLAAVNAASTSSTTSLLSAEDAALLPPPPAAYQTASVHGPRRGKFVANPLPNDMNTFYTGTDHSGSVAGGSAATCRYDLSHLVMAPPPAGATTSTAAEQMTATSNSPPLYNNTESGAAMGTTSTVAAAATAAAAAAAVAASTIALGSTTTVDIMEDEEENEQQRLGNCPHGTPSRIPLISGHGQHVNAQASASARTTTTTTSTTTSGGGGDDKSSTRGLLNATAASFHRHTLQHFHRGSGNRKTMFALPVVGRGMRRRMQATGSSGGSAGSGCNLHSGTSSYANTDANETSEDESMQRAHSEEYVLERFNASEKGSVDDLDEQRHHHGHHKQHQHFDNDEADGHDEYCHHTDDDDDDADDDDEDGGRERHFQVPISIVLLILICYICLGTVIFALWENWSLIDGAYFCFVTLATIGYGDFLPERTFRGPEVQLFACCAYLLLGLVLVAMSFSIMETQLLWKCKRIAVRLKLAKD